MGRKWRWSEGGLGVYFGREGGDTEDVFLVHKRALMALWFWGSSVVKRSGWHCPVNYFHSVHLSWTWRGCLGIPHIPRELDSFSPEPAEPSTELGKCAVGTNGLGPQCLSVFSEQGMMVTSGFFHLSSVQLLKIVSKVFLLSSLESFAMTDWTYSTLLINTVCSGLLRFSVSSGCLGYKKEKEINSANVWASTQCHELWLAAEPSRRVRPNLCPP